MPTEDNERVLASRRPLRDRPLLAGATAVIVALATVTGLVLAQVDDTAIAPSSAEPTQAAIAAPTAVDERTVIVSRLRQILRIREAAYRSRNYELLETIYASDCPCLESDKSAIRELISLDYVWVGISSSIDVRSTDQVHERLWNINADFRSAPLRIEAADGRLIREEPAGSNLFQFTLAKPAGNHWLLARVTLFEGG